MLLLSKVEKITEQECIADCFQHSGGYPPEKFVQFSGKVDDFRSLI